MYPERNKTALPKKNMLWLRELVGSDSDAANLLPLALARVKQRVVVKRPRLAETISEIKPSLAITGSSCRFDVYLINKGQ
jgi:16S rRNA (guanine1516-N2)-methyltransferase